MPQPDQTLCKDLQDHQIIVQISLQDHPPGSDPEAERKHVLEARLPQELDAFFDAVEVVDRNVASKDRLRDGAETTRRQTSPSCGKSDIALRHW